MDVSNLDLGDMKSRDIGNMISKRLWILAKMSLIILKIKTMTMTMAICLQGHCQN